MRYLEREEKCASTELWQEAFVQDSPQFVDFYYSDKIKNNQILVKEEDGAIISMAHLNPYQVVIRNQRREINYVVGVATTAAKRHKGHMRDILKKMLQDMYDKNMEFCFLMPADEKIYLPFDFTYIFDQPQWILKDGKKLLRCPYHREEHEDEVKAWLKQWLETRFEVYCIRDDNYLKLFEKELSSEQGTWELLFDESRLVGMECWWGIDKRVCRALYAEEAYLEQRSLPKPAIMARIVNLNKFIRVITLKPTSAWEEMTVVLSVKDSILGENQGRYLWHITHETSWLEICPDGYVGETDGNLSVSVSELTGWLFGYTSGDFADWCHEISTLRKIFLDEVV